MAFPKLWEKLFGPSGQSETLTPTILPTASESAKGAVELATSSEAETGTDGTKAVTPVHLKGLEDAVLAAIDTANGAK